jgi:hypothetical protein
MDSRYVVGIDLGTTNSVLAYLDATADQPQIQTLPIPQIVGAGVVETRPCLPSFLYLAAGPEFSKNALDLPWASGRSYCVGEFARTHGAAVPSRLVASAKSWLSNPGVDSSAALLPFQAPDDVPKISPVDTAARYLEHLRDAWNQNIAADDPFEALESQQVLLTVPASFDAVAREMTMTAAKRAGLTNVTLLEEPQAAFYAWLAGQGEAWRDRVRVGDVALVCDVGGGTTDFTLIIISEANGELCLERVAVGDHILLGGDNMDLALALVASGRLAERGLDLDPWQTRSLWYACRDAKERLYSDQSLDRTRVTVLGRGSRVVGGTVSTELSQGDLDRILIGGFFPVCNVGDKPQAVRRTGLQELGLPYAADAAITKHLAHFLSQHADRKTGSHFAKPSVVLFNGGVMKAAAVRRQMLDVVNGWVGSEAQPLRELKSESLELAVGHGAAYYGLVRRGRGVRIRGGVARSYYVGIESAIPAVPGLEAPLKALCVVPYGMEEGSEADVEQREFGMVVGEPVAFRFLSSTVRKDDSIGTLVDRVRPAEIDELDPIHTAMSSDDKNESGRSVPVRLHTRLTEVGTLDLELRARDGRRWKLELQVREPRRA